MKIACDRCGGETKWKKVTSKKNGKTYDMLECLKGCMDGRFAHSFFQGQTTSSQGSSPMVVDVPKGVPQEVGLLNEINQKLAIIISYVKEIKDRNPEEEDQIS